LQQNSTRGQFMISQYGSQFLNNTSTEIDLSTGYGFTGIASTLQTNLTRYSYNVTQGGPADYGITTSTTSITFYASYFGSTGTFLAKGSIKFYGVK
jgi:hypothetical protein